MAIRHVKQTPYNDAEGVEGESREWQKKWANDPKTVPLKHNMSKAHMSGDDDPLHAALAARIPVLPSDNHEYRPSSRVHPTGVHYSPAGEFGLRHRMGAGRGVYSYGGNRHSAVPGNAIGSPPNRRGDNALPGHQNTRHGQNAIGSPPHRHGENAVGNPPNRAGENALGAAFRPRFGRPHGHRV